jgi:hypothetical protein
MLWMPSLLLVVQATSMDGGYINNTGEAAIPKHEDNNTFAITMSDRLLLDSPRRRLPQHVGMDDRFEDSRANMEATLLIPSSVCFVATVVAIGKQLKP